MVTLKRLDQIKKNSYEKAAWDEQKVVCGIDEVGRGCLAGPLVTAAAILYPNRKSPLLQDSKLLSKPELIKGYDWIVKNAWFAYGIVDHRTIDAVNIWQATLLAMKKALVHLLATCPTKPSLVLVDAMPLNLADTSYLGIDVHHFPKGESKSCSIAAASIVAKVTRDAIMAKYDPLLPGYQFGQHKGYGTAIHKAALLTYKASIIHRQSFLNDPLISLESDYEEQQTLC